LERTGRYDDRGKRNEVKIVRAGVVGVGYLGQYHAEKYAGMQGVELVGVVDPDHGRASDVAGKLKTQAYRESSELLGRVDAVSIVAPTVLHHRIAKQFLDAGVHVLLEKPITVTLEQADELIDLAARKNVVLQVGHIERFNPAVAAIKPLLQRPKYIQAERSAPFTVRCTDVSVVLDLMIHDLDIVCDLAGVPPRTVSAAGASIITRDIDSAVARIIFGNGCIADVAASRVSDEKKRLLKVFDEDSLFAADFQTQKATVSRRGTGNVPELITAELPTERSDTLREEIGAFIRSVSNGERPLVAGPEGRNALALALLIARNIEAGVTSFVPV
jgi:predicted dehydrogenase